MIPKKIIHLMSGGLDSVTLLHELHRQEHLVHCIFFDYSQKHLYQELSCAQKHTERLNVPFTQIVMPTLDTHRGNVVPARNAIFLNMAAHKAAVMGADTITIGCNADDEAGFPDCRKAFIKSVNQSIKLMGYNIEACAPYIELNKAEIIAKAESYNIHREDVWWCYEGGSQPCGECGSCLKMP
ncbi:MAG: hypothetical protein CBD27_03115 [Rhodospirillaceae bacterium TMED167]|nr:MAG: hypothetical protein CBD27_03115 [Rhodospirillaceae bacterium TMED167]|tara:strand:- start:683 stop:1231 length:549 start_codon:yes stop_codon:yes gene_type:complete